jgi:uncharacterized protein YllA (UPF0747 family)
VRADAESISPGAALRPVVQDAALPVLCTVAGPGELGYLRQIGPIYPAIGIERSALFPRLSVTVIDRRTAEHAARFGLTGAKVLEARRMLEQFDPEALLEPDARVDAIDAARRTLIERLPDDDKVAAKAHDSINHQVDKVLDRMRHAQLTRRGIGKGQLKALALAVAPEGRPAERVVSMLDAVGRYGRTLIEQLAEQLDPWTIAHRLVTVGLRETGDEGGRR